MSKAKTAAADATTEGQDTVQASTEGQDTVQASTEGQDQAGADLDAADPAPGPNLRVLNHLTKQIEMLNHFGLRQGLVDEMRDLYGAEIVELDGTFAISIEGVSIDPADSLENALTLWANAARRAILEGANQGAGA
jgi:hypothetical protein